MSTYGNANDPFLQFVTNGGNPLTFLITEDPKQCCLCKHESRSLFILTFNKLACQGCFDFALNCNFFEQSNPIDLNLSGNFVNMENEKEFFLEKGYPYQKVVNF